MPARAARSEPCVRARPGFTGLGDSNGSIPDHESLGLTRFKFFRPASVGPTRTPNACRSAPDERARTPRARSVTPLPETIRLSLASVAPHHLGNMPMVRHRVMVSNSRGVALVNGVLKEAFVISPTAGDDVLRLEPRVFEHEPHALRCPTPAIEGRWMNMKNERRCYEDISAVFQPIEHIFRCPPWIADMLKYLLSNDEIVIFVERITANVELGIFFRCEAFPLSKITPGLAGNLADIHSLGRRGAN
ncbi:hypothetical protein BHAOGJBA_6217 [Methylobacterium hispanicum]|uniref:Uncharacterized protein n=1 Tax=Methylobacterium hispanicum TaxID=270350 RepID=A0AAV4ZVK7_9HYPH|nr:hypothetical protein BHAOGJBA_6217 [Methylobacterium hispanicum]